MTIARRPIASIEQVDGLQGALTDPELLRSRAALSKGVIGTGGKPAIAIRFDDGQDAIKSTVYALMNARGLPFSLATIAQGPDAGQPWWSPTTTWDDVRTWVNNGGEIWSHGYDHRDQTPIGTPAAWVREIVESKTTLEGLGFKVQGFAKPGNTPLTPDDPFPPDGFNTLIPGYQGVPGQLLLRTYPLSESYAGSSWRPMPPNAYHGSGHFTVSDAVTLANGIDAIDRAVRYRMSIRLMCHPHNLGTAGNLSVADFTTLLDYIVSLWDAGTIEVLTPSGLCFADIDRTDRINLVNDNSFENGLYWTVSAAHEVKTTGGRTGANFLSVPNTSTAFTTQRPAHIGTRLLGGETFVFEGWCRSNGAGTTSARILLQDYTDNSRLTLTISKAGVTTTWTRFRKAFTVPLGCTTLTVGVGRSSGDGVDWDDINVWKV